MAFNCARVTSCKSSSVLGASTHLKSACVSCHQHLFTAFSDTCVIKIQALDDCCNDRPVASFPASHTPPGTLLLLRSVWSCTSCESTHPRHLEAVYRFAVHYDSASSARQKQSAACQVRPPGPLFRPFHKLETTTTEEKKPWAWWNGELASTNPFLALQVFWDCVISCMPLPITTTGALAQSNATGSHWPPDFECRLEWCAALGWQPR